MFINSDELYLASQIRQLESFVIDEDIIEEPVLMETAGRAALQALRDTWPAAAKLIVFCGKGHNAGDGLVLARLAQEVGIQVTAVLLYDLDMMRPRATEMAEKASHAGVEFIPWSIMRGRDVAAIDADVVVDALLGIGLKGEVEDDFLAAIEFINSIEKPTLAIDLPSGLDADSGRVLGDAVKAQLTVTFIGLKQGMFTHRSVRYCGKVLCSDLNIPDETYRQLSPSARLLTWKVVKQNLPKRVRDANKGNYGHVLVIGGDYGMGGAVRMAAEAAMRAGAGLVSVATRPEHVNIVNASRPEIMCHQVAEAKDLDRLIANCSVIVLGPGLGQSEWAQELFERVLRSDKPKVLDADSLNLLSKQQYRCNEWILTPHPGEAARLLQAGVEEMQDDRFAAVTELQQCYGGVAVLKGAGTIIKSDDPVPAVCRAGNPGMASGGMGDVLSGVIGGLLAQDLDIFAAAEVGVFVHAVAADRAAAEHGERGLLATDLLPHIRALVNP